LTLPRAPHIVTGTITWAASAGRLFLVLEGEAMADKVPVSVTVNGAAYTRDVEPRDLLVYFLREDLGLTGTHVGCDTSQCGACTILVDNRPVKSCTMFAVQANGRQLRTIEGVATDGKLHPIQEAFWNEHGLQCGFCTPGFLMLFAGALEDDPRLDHDERRLEEMLASNLCRCTGYVNIRRAVLRAARELRGEASPGE
jgi:aerobic carbon-monoxide dehydrogenase small subunit